MASRDFERCLEEVRHRVASVKARHEATNALVVAIDGELAAERERAETTVPAEIAALEAALAVKREQLQAAAARVLSLAARRDAEQARADAYQALTERSEAALSATMRDDDFVGAGAGAGAGASPASATAVTLRVKRGVAGKLTALARSMLDAETTIRASNGADTSDDVEGSAASTAAAPTMAGDVAAGFELVGAIRARVEASDAGELAPLLAELVADAPGGVTPAHLTCEKGRPLLLRACAIAEVAACKVAAAEAGADAGAGAGEETPAADDLAASLAVVRALIAGGAAPHALLSVQLPPSLTRAYSVEVAAAVVEGCTAVDADLGAVVSALLAAHEAASAAAKAGDEAVAAAAAASAEVQARMEDDADAVLAAAAVLPPELADAALATRLKTSITDSYREVRLPIDIDAKGRRLAGLSPDDLAWAATQLVRGIRERLELLTLAVVDGGAATSQRCVSVVASLGQYDLACAMALRNKEANERTDAGVNARFQGPTTLLHLAARHRAPLATIQSIITAGAEVNSTCQNNNTVLHECVRTDDVIQVAKLLVDSGADCRAQNAEGKMPAAAASQDTELGVVQQQHDQYGRYTRTPLHAFYKVSKLVGALHGKQHHNNYNQYGAI